MTLAPLSFGFRMEAFFRRLLKYGGLEQAENDFTAESLLLDAQLNDPHRVARVKRNVHLSKATAADILDWVYGIDHLIKVSNTDAQAVYAAIDLTTDPSAVAKKMNKANGLRKLWSAIGVAQFFVVLVKGDPEDLTAEGRDALLDELWDQMAQAFNGPMQHTHVIRLSIK